VVGHTQLGAEEGYDVHRLFERLRREQQQFADRLVLSPPRNAVSESDMALHEELLPPGGKSDSNKSRSPEYGG